MTELLIPLLFLAAAVTAMARRQETYAVLLRGAQGWASPAGARSPRR